MIEDYLTRRVTAEDSTENLVKRRLLGGNIAGIESNRDQFLGQLGSRIGGMTGRAPSYSQEKPKLRRTIEGLAAKNKYSNSRAQFDQLFQLALQQAQEAGLDQRAAIEYARKTADQQSEIDFQAAEAQRGRDFKWKMNNLQNEYSDKNNALYSEDDDSNAALMRVLLGVGTSVGTSYYLNKSLANKNQSIIPQGSYADKMNQSLKSADNQSFARNQVGDYGIRSYGGKF